MNKLLIGSVIALLILVAVADINPASLLSSTGKISCSKTSLINSLECGTNTGATISEGGSSFNLEIENNNDLKVKQFNSIYEPILRASDSTANKFFQENQICYVSAGKITYKASSIQDKELYGNSILKVRAVDESSNPSKSGTYSKCGNYWYQINPSEIVSDNFKDQLIVINGMIVDKSDNNKFIADFKIDGLCDMSSGNCKLNNIDTQNTLQISTIEIKLKKDGYTETDLCSEGFGQCYTEGTVEASNLNDIQNNATEKAESIFAKFFSWLKSLFGGSS